MAGAAIASALAAPTECPSWCAKRSQAHRHGWDHADRADADRWCERQVGTVATTEKERLTVGVTRYEYLEHGRSHQVVPPQVTINQQWLTPGAARKLAALLIAAAELVQEQEDTMTTESPDCPPWCIHDDVDEPSGLRMHSYDVYPGRGVIAQIEGGDAPLFWLEDRFFEEGLSAEDARGLASVLPRVADALEDQANWERADEPVRPSPSGDLNVLEPREAVLSDFAARAKGEEVTPT